MSNLESSSLAGSAANNSSAALTFEQEVHALLWRGLVFARDLLLIFEREALALDGEERRLMRMTMDHVRADVARFEAIIPKATAWRDAAGEET